MNLPSSTIGTKCPLPMTGYRIIVSIFFLSYFGIFMRYRSKVNGMWRDMCLIQNFL
jgi:hypothetical protein